MSLLNVLCEKWQGMPENEKKSEIIAGLWACYDWDKWTFIYLFLTDNCIAAQNLLCSFTVTQKKSQPLKVSFCRPQQKSHAYWDYKPMLDSQTQVRGQTAEVRLRRAAWNIQGLTASNDGAMEQSWLLMAAATQGGEASQTCVWKMVEPSLVTTVINCNPVFSKINNS